MTPIVNNQYRYIMLYSAKVACTSMRMLFLDLHRNELSDTLKEELKLYHNVNELFPFDPNYDYSGHFTFLITRDPYSRLVSAFIDQYAYAKNQGIWEMFEHCPPKRGEPDNFVELLEYLVEVPNELRDSHFQTQSYFQYARNLVTKSNSVLPWFSALKRNTFRVRVSSDLQEYQQSMQAIYSKVMHNYPVMKNKAHDLIKSAKHHNRSLYSDQTYENVAEMSLHEIDTLIFAPKPQDFFVQPRVRKLAQQIYAEDFRNFAYNEQVIPNKAASREASEIPLGFNWQTYRYLNPDIPHDLVYNQRTAARHYLKFGRYEKVRRPYKIEAPSGFDWQAYIARYADLQAAGIESYDTALEHYVRYGAREGRSWL